MSLFLMKQGGGTIKKREAAFFFLSQNHFVFHSDKLQSLSRTELRKNSRFDLCPGLKGREEKIYIHEELKAQKNHRFIC